jgi:hypothetical protein
MYNDFDRFVDVLARVTMPNENWRIEVRNDTGNPDTAWTPGRPFLQIVCDEGICNVTGKPMKWTSRKWFLSPHMTDGEIVQTALKACLTAAEHEIREKFKYRGMSIFDPHYDIEKLVELRRNPDSIKERDEIILHDEDHPCGQRHCSICQ